MSRRGRGLRFRLRPLRRRSLQRVLNTRCMLPRRQDRLPPVGHEDRTYQPERRGPLRPRRRRDDGLTPHEYRISLAAPSHRPRRGLRAWPRSSYAPRLPVASGGGDRKSRGPQNARHPRSDFSEDSKRVKGRYEPAFRSLPVSWASPSANYFDLTAFREVRLNLSGTVGRAPFVVIALKRRYYLPVAHHPHRWIRVRWVAGWFHYVAFLEP